MVNRTTLTLETDVYCSAKNLADSRKISLGKAIGELAGGHEGQRQGSGNTAYNTIPEFFRFHLRYDMQTGFLGEEKYPVTSPC